MPIDFNTHADYQIKMGEHNKKDISDKITIGYLPKVNFQMFVNPKTG
jgi:hypothetical protein